VRCVANSTPFLRPVWAYGGVMPGPEKREIWRIHAGLILAEMICIPAFLIEIVRALGGNTLSWAYVFEWPILGAYAIYMWRRLLLDVRGVPRPVRTSRPQPVDEEKLAEWNRYLDSVHRRDGGSE